MAQHKKAEATTSFTSKIIRNKNGAVLLEFAFILPVLALMLFAVIEFGWYFIRFEALNRAVSVVSESIITTGGAVTQAVANGAGSGIIPFGTSGNYICSQAFQTDAHATAASPVCTSETWALGGSTVICSDTGIACTVPYFVGITAHAASSSLTGLISTIIPEGTTLNMPYIMTVGAGGGTGGGSSIAIPTCPAGQVLTGNGSTLSCTAGSFGGAYTVEAYEGMTSCIGYVAPATMNNSTGNCACPTGYVAKNMATTTDSGSANSDQPANQYFFNICVP